ncbi:hypothetical protein GCM10010168_47620 [Actinoplanes ianthinogenes]|uniref:Protein kinase domain-containing protein n=1 Tax=Actinoplanes ianthinogenes TaxID=122358 RepID=A0ABM7LNS0_9ACTN|nr:serine/threonine-protein kinase [Actinoplanes ianthinogenes]BCJ40938.1 hypothetical protein Aiant_15950 [Actinoplanes ianthinogenes]GGR24083.1 hypothetical protein GCM10010168_47620 [Actinoplanes ianthinogenes]
MSGDYHVGPPDDPDKYRLRHEVGVGGEGALWQAEHEIHGGSELVAIKMLRPDRDVTEWRTRWMEQADLLRHISGPGIVAVHSAFLGAERHPPGAAGAPDTTLYLVMNWVDGDNLYDRQPFSRKDAFRTLGQIASILDRLHSGAATGSGRVVCHGDLSPANVMINQDGQAILIDFGLSQLRRTTADAPMGTPGYIAPELFSGGEYSPASDRYAFGCLAVFLLTGAPPADEPAKQLAAHQGVPPEVVAPIFAAEPDDRPGAAEWLRSIRNSATTAIGADSVAPRPPMPTAVPAAGSNTLGFVILSLLVVSLIWLSALNEYSNATLMHIAGQILLPVAVAAPLVAVGMSLAAYPSRSVRLGAAAVLVGGGFLLGRAALSGLWWTAEANAVAAVLSFLIVLLSVPVGFFLRRVSAPPRWKTLPTWLGLVAVGIGGGAAIPPIIELARFRPGESMVEPVGLGFVTTVSAALVAMIAYFMVQVPGSGRALGRLARLLRRVRRSVIVALAAVYVLLCCTFFILAGNSSF